MEQGGVSECLFSGADGPRGRKNSWQLPYTDISIERPGWTFLLILAGTATTIGLSLPVGYNIGVVNTPAEIIKEFCRNIITERFGNEPSTYQLELIWSSIVSIFLVGAAIGSLGGSVLADKIGRKGVLAVCSGLAALSALVFFISRPVMSIELLFIGRLLVGFSSGLTTTVVPMYLTELAPIHLRGSTGVLCPLGVTIGVLMGQIMSMHDILGNNDYWPYCLAAYVIPVIICSFTLPILPESPKYLFVIKRDQQRAVQQLNRLRNSKQSAVNLEILELKKEQQDNEKNTRVGWSIGKVLVDRSLLLPLLLVCSLQAGQQLSGINAVFYYSNAIFKKAGLSDRASELGTIGSGLCNNFMAFLSVWTMSRFNRRFCIQVSTITSAIFLIILGFAIKYIDSYSWVPYLSIIGVQGYVLCYGFGLGPIPYFIGSELFEVGPRPSAMALGSMSSWGGNFIVGLTFPLMQTYLGAASFFIFALVALGLFLFTRFYLPETRGKDITEVVELCNQGLSSQPLQRNVPENQRMNTSGNV
ncbi:solute carrier family 2, facilitated glucose transporter member 1-like isoform X1 [Diabrotica virgifera virgifera]|uniref:Major facilitator superfamily (MFS) profile domain-containing protein n=1 Tax=Diabrotica virgifera virgifera TaxID=50390 RepID=A0ABM5JUK3_DIAVI|nr:solute carrier family 2, facilitated glucose transporter member 1-like isoform X1 [Diabrotica virgifera virgifera]